MPLPFILFKDRRGTIKKIADFLGKLLTDDDIDNILEHTSLENMRKNEAVNMSYIEKHRETDNSEGVFISKGKPIAYEPHHEKSCYRDFRPRPTQTGKYSYKR